MKLLLAIAFVAAVFLVVFRFMSRPMIFIGSAAPLAEEARLKQTFPPIRVVEYQASDGNLLRGAYFHDASQERPVIVAFHGNAETAAHNLPFGAALFAQGFDVFLAEYRGYAGLPGSPSEKGVYRDGQGALRWLELAGIPPHRIVLLGRSLGTGVAVELASMRSPRALVLVAPFTSAVDVGRSVVGPLSPLLVRDRFDSISKMTSIAAPVVIIHGEKDEVIPVRMGRQMAASRPGIHYVELPGVTHNNIPDLAAIVGRELKSLLGPRKP